MRSSLCRFSFTFAALTVISVAAQQQRTLEIQPFGPVITKAVGQSLGLTCKPNVDDPKLITELEWRDPMNRRIDNTDPKSKSQQLYVQQLSSESGAVLIFPHLQKNMAGEYTCSAKYANTESMRVSIVVDTIVDISFVTAPESQYPLIKTDYIIKCVVEAEPSPVVEWVKNNVLIKSNDRYQISAKGLLIKNITESDDGTYTCKAMVLETGSIKERNIKVEVQIPPQIKPIIEQTITEGEQATIICSAAGKPPPEYEWIKETTREDLSKTDRFSVRKDTGALYITKAEYGDNSDYRCVARNAAGVSDTIVKINVLVKPQIYEYINITTPINSETNIICRARGRPTPTIVFRKLSQRNLYTTGPQKTDSRIIIDQQFDNNKGEAFGILSILGVNRTDDGLYECIAENQVGTAYKNGHITVEFPPTFEKTKDYPPAFAWGDKPGNLSCIAESIPNATITWKYNEIEIKGDSTTFKIVSNGPQSNLIVMPYNDKRRYTKYDCFAKNKLGENRISIELKEATIPGLVQQVTKADLTATTVKFNIVGPPSFNALPLRAFIVRYQLRDRLSWDTAFNKTWSIDAPYIVEGLIPQQTYMFQFAAKNEVGVGNFGGNQDVTMPRRSVPAEPKILVTNFNGNSTWDFVANSPYADHFELRWNVPSDNGDPIDKYQIRYCVTQRVNGEWRDSNDECSTNITTSYEYTQFELNQLYPDTTYKIELRAHNAIGFSLPAQIRVKTARGIDTAVYNHEGPAISSAMIIGIVIGIVLLILIIVDILCFCVNRAGILALLCSRSKGIEEDDPKLGREEKEPLSPEYNNRPISQNGDMKNITVEFDGNKVYTKPTEIGRHSAV